MLHPAWYISATIFIVLVATFASYSLLIDGYWIRAIIVLFSIGCTFPLWKAFKKKKKVYPPPPPPPPWRTFRIKGIDVDGNSATIEFQSRQEYNGVSIRLTEDEKDIFFSGKSAIKVIFNNENGT